jgi:SAM-dependent methyltransferase
VSSNFKDYEYLLGDGDAELERLAFQHSVWGPVTARFFDRLKVAEGWRCLDVGAGPGLVSIDLRERVGDSGEVVALEPSDYYREWFEKEIKRRGWSNVFALEGNSFDAALPRNHFDLIFIRWVIGFVPDPVKFLQPLITSLRPGGIIAVQDYIHEGCALFPNGGAWDRLPEVMRAWWRSGGGDPHVAARLPAVMKQLNLQPVDYHPNTLTGGPHSPVTEWIERFQKSQLPVMVERGLLTATEADAIWSDWQEHRENPDTLFFSPYVVDIAARRPLS